MNKIFIIGLITIIMFSGIAVAEQKGFFKEHINTNVITFGDNIGSTYETKKIVFKGEKQMLCPHVFGAECPKDVAGEVATIEYHDGAYGDRYFEITNEYQRIRMTPNQMIISNNLGINTIKMNVTGTYFENRFGGKVYIGGKEVLTKE